MFLLVSVRHVGAHPGEHQHGVSIQISISLGKTFLRISRIRNILLTWILARVFVYVPPFISKILDFIYWTVSIFILICFEWRDTKNQPYACINTRKFKVLDSREITSLPEIKKLMAHGTWHVIPFIACSSQDPLISTVRLFQSNQRFQAIEFVDRHVSRKL